MPVKRCHVPQRGARPSKGPVYLSAVVLFVERLTLMLRAFRRWRAPAEPQALSEQIAAHRTAVVEAVLRT